MVGPSPDVDFVLAICLQSNIPLMPVRTANSTKLQTGPAPSTSDLSGSSKFKPTRDRHAGKRKDVDSMLTIFYFTCSFFLCCIIGLSSLLCMSVVIAW